MRELDIAPVAEEDDRAEHHGVRVRDGVVLATDVYLPDAALGPVPTVLMRLPYDKSGRYTFIPQVGEYFAAHGFACVAQDVRGKYRSEGVRRPFVNEGNDGWDTVDWIVSRPWSDGAVGTWGDSYYGFTQWALAALNHPAHRAMVPRVTGHRFGDLRPGGGLPTYTLLDWVVDAWSIPELVVGNGVLHDVSPAVESVHPDLPAGGELYREYVAVAASPDEWVAALFPAGNPACQLRVPALHIGGWFDNLQFWHLDDWEAASVEAPAAAHQFLRMRTNDHEDIDWREPGTPMGPDFGGDDEALAEHLSDLLDETISFLTHYLGGAPGRWTAPRVRFEHARVGTRVAAQWPPKRVSEVRWHLSPGLLGPTPAFEGSVVEWKHDPADPVPLLIVSEWDQNRPGLPDERRLHDRDDVACFTTPPLTEHLDIVGRVHFEGRISARTQRTDVIARLCDVAPDGSARLILANGVSAVADGTTPFRIRLGDTAYRLPVGHRLRLAVSTSLFGQYVVHPGTDEDPWTATTRVPSVQRLHLDGAGLAFTQDGELPRL